MAQTVWSGSIGFGLVSIPVKLVPATQSKSVSFHQLDRKTNSRIRYKKVAEVSGEEVKKDDIVKGYEFEPNKWVVVDQEDIDDFAPQASRTVEITDFVDLASIDPIYFQSSYYVVPEENALKPYRLLVNTMEELGKVAVGRIVLRAKEHLVAVRPRDGVLCIETMRYADEIVDAKGLVSDEQVQLTEQESQIAQQLVMSLSAEFDAQKYSDTFREQLLELIGKKAKGEEFVAESAPEPEGKVLDLMKALEASLAKMKPGREGSEEQKGTG